jgi:hypothetical protein
VPIFTRTQLAGATQVLEESAESATIMLTALQGLLTIAKSLPTFASNAWSQVIAQQRPLPIATLLHLPAPHVLIHPNAVDFTQATGGVTPQMGFAMSAATTQIVPQKKNLSAI